MKQLMPFVVALLSLTGAALRAPEYFGEHAAEAPCGSARTGIGRPGDQRRAVGAHASWE
jgi:hypothetical protein